MNININKDRNKQEYNKQQLINNNSKVKKNLKDMQFNYMFLIIIKSKIKR